MKYENIIFVAGAARSFTSLTAGILYYAGAWGQKDNFEGRDEPVFENVNLLDSFDQAAKGFKAVEFVSTPEVLSGCLRLIAQSVFDKHSAPDDRIIFLKHPGLIVDNSGVAWQHWHNAFPEAKWIVVRRDTREIEQSHFKLYGKIKFHNREVLTQIPIMLSHFENAGTKHFEIWPGQELQDPKRTRFKEMVSWAGLKWNKKIEEFITPDKHHCKITPAP